jgi:hypothetical protein
MGPPQVYVHIEIERGVVCGPAFLFRVQSGGDGLLSIYCRFHTLRAAAIQGILNVGNADHHCPRRTRCAFHKLRFSIGKNFVVVNPKYVTPTSVCLSTSHHWLHGRFDPRKVRTNRWSKFHCPRFQWFVGVWYHMREAGSYGLGCLGPCSP